LLRRNGSRHEYRAEAERREEAAPVFEPCSESTPETDLATLEMRLLVRTAIAALPAVHRQAVELRELEDYSYQEMAEIIDCPIGTVMSRLHHARHHLAVDLRSPLKDELALAAA
jgi:RNA polymerase sigma-70 factor, ECF subfamily